MPSSSKAAFIRVKRPERQRRSLDDDVVVTDVLVEKLGGFQRLLESHRLFHVDFDGDVEMRNFTLRVAIRCAMVLRIVDSSSREPGAPSWGEIKRRKLELCCSRTKLSMSRLVIRPSGPVPRTS